MSEPTTQHAFDAASPTISTVGFKLTEFGNAERFVARYRDCVRYCPPRRAWLIWDGRRWAWDDRGEIVQLAKLTVRAIFVEVQRANGQDERKHIFKHANNSEKASSISATLRLAQSEPGIPVMPDELDADPWLFNCQNGTVDLRTGELKPHNRTDLISKLSPVTFDPEARSEEWDRFLDTATAGDTDFAHYLRRVAGYALTGQSTEKKFFFVYGPQNTAKSTFVDALSETWGDYHVTADFDTWCAQTRTGGNRGDLVRLAGARLVTSVEVAKGKRFDETIMKRVTGGDEITAAAKFEAEVTFRPQFKLVLAANDPPRVREDDAPIWGRVRRLPFMAMIANPDPKVKETLRDPEVSGAAILAWAVNGCLEWQRTGLGTAAAVEKSTEAYREEMDTTAPFFEECCRFDPASRVSRASLRYEYERWARESGVRHMLGAKQFTEKVEERLRAQGVPKTQTVLSGVRHWVGVTVGMKDDPSDVLSDS